MCGIDGAEEIVQWGGIVAVNSCRMERFKVRFEDTTEEGFDFVLNSILNKFSSM